MCSGAEQKLYETTLETIKTLGQVVDVRVLYI